MSSTWHNWSGYESWQPEKVHRPVRVDEVVHIVRDCRQQQKQLRVIGSGHSFTALVPTNQWMMSLDGLQGLDALSRDDGHATVWAGTKLQQLGELLYENGLAQENLGDIDVQAIAGALSTGTHGTGAGFGTLSTQIEGLEMVDGLGNIHWADREQNRELFQFGRIALGSLGVITRLKLRVEPAYKLEFKTGKEHLSSVLQSYPRYLQENRNYEFYWFPYSGWVQNKFSNRTDKPARANGPMEYLTDVVLENYVFKLFSEFARLFPSSAASVSRLSARAVSTSSKVNWSHRVYATARLVRFQEMEYNIPREAFADVVRLMDERMQREKFRVHFPIECRFVAPDDIPLSPAYNRESAYIAIHMYKGMPWEEYFHAMEDIFLAHGGRPHWGKMHRLKAADLAPRYPLWDSFMAVRQRMDPEGIFLNPYLRGLFGLE